MMIRSSEEDRNAAENQCESSSGVVENNDHLEMDFDDLMKEVLQGVEEGVQPELHLKGTSGIYLVKDRSLVSVPFSIRNNIFLGLITFK